MFLWFWLGQLHRPSRRTVTSWGFHCITLNLSLRKFFFRCLQSSHIFLLRREQGEYLRQDMFLLANELLDLGVTCSRLLKHLFWSTRRFTEETDRWTVFLPKFPTDNNSQRLFPRWWNSAHLPRNITGGTELPSHLAAANVCKPRRVSTSPVLKWSSFVFGQT